MVGRRHYLFDVWGDTVNTTARVEANGRTGAVTVSEDALDEIADACEFQSLGEVEAKGKGRLPLFRVLRLREGH